MFFSTNKQRNLFIATALVGCLYITACNSSSRENLSNKIEEKTADTTTVIVKTDAVESIKIKNQEWALKNLNVSSFKNGDVIPEITSAEEWETAGAAGKPAWCYFDNDSANGKLYGKLYNWYAVKDSRGLAPAGWHIPSNDEWTALTDNLGGADVAGIKLKADTGWLEKGNGNNISGFTALPGGYRFFAGLFLNAGQDGGWWTSTAYSDGYAWLRYLYSNDRNIFTNHMHCKMGFSVRCIKD